MNFLTEKISYLSRQRTPTLSVLAFIYLSFIVIIFSLVGVSPLAYLALAVIAAIFILPSYYSLGLGLIIILTMLFERFFTLTPLIIDRTTIKLYPLDIIIGLSLVAWIVNYRFGRIKAKLFLGWPEKILLFFMAGVTLYLARAIFDINSEFEVAFSTFKNYAFYPLLYFLVIYSVQDRKQLKNITNLILAAGLGIIGFLIIGIFRGEGLWTQFTPLSTSGVRLLAGTHAFYLCLASLLAISLLIFKRFSNGAMAYLVLLIWFAGIFFSLMRHLWLAMAVALVILFLIIPLNNKKILKDYLVKNGLIIITIIAILSFLAILFPNNSSLSDLYSPVVNLNERVVSLFQSGSDTSIQWRFDVWNYSRDVWLTNPIFGVGFGKKILIDVDGWQTFEEIRNIHNSPLTILVQMGILGLAFFLAIISSVILASWKHIKANQELQPHYLGLIACLGLILIASLFQPYLETNLTGIFLWITLGLISASRIINQKHENSPSQ